MSNISELRARVTELESNVGELNSRIAICESILLKMTEEAKGMQTFPGERHEIGEVRNPIGFKPAKSPKK